MGKTRNLNGIPGNLALSYLSTLGYYNGGYMADWLNYIGREKNIKEITVDIINNSIEPKEADITALKFDLNKLRLILKKELSKNGFEMNFIKNAALKFEIPIDNPKFKNTVCCYPYIEDETGKIYKPKNEIIETAYEVGFNPNKRERIKIEKIDKSWIYKIKGIFN